jgi:hypothetical protein
LPEQYGICGTDGSVNSARKSPNDAKPGSAAPGSHGRRRRSWRANFPGRIRGSLHGLSRGKCHRLSRRTQLGKRQLGMERWERDRDCRHHCLRSSGTEKILHANAANGRNKPEPKGDRRRGRVCVDLEPWREIAAHKEDYTQFLVVWESVESCFCISGRAVMARKKRAARAWSKEDVKNLKSLAKAKYSTVEVAKKLRRTRTAVSQKAMLLGVRFRSIDRKKR